MDVETSVSDGTEATSSTPFAGTNRIRFRGSAVCPHSQRRLALPCPICGCALNPTPAPEWAMSRLAGMPAAAHPATNASDKPPRHGVEIEVVTFDESTHTAQEAADAIGVQLGQIVKSLVFMAPADPPVTMGAVADRGVGARHRPRRHRQAGQRQRPPAPAACQRQGSRLPRPASPSAASRPSVTRDASPW